MYIISDLPSWAQIALIWLGLGLVGKIFLEMADAIVKKNGGSFWIRETPPLIRHLVTVLAGILCLLVGLIAIWGERSEVGILFRRKAKK